MEHRALAALILRVAGLLIIVWAITDAVRQLAPFLHRDSARGVAIGLLLLAGLAAVAIPVILGLFLLYFPGTITSKVLRIPGTEPTQDALLPGYERVAFAAIGLWLTVHALIDSLYIYARARLYLRIVEDWPSYSKPPSMSPEDFAGLVASALQLVLGVWLLLGSRGLANMLQRLRG